MSSTAGKGTKLYIETAGPAWTQVSEVVDIDPPALSNPAKEESILTDTWDTRSSTTPSAGPLKAKIKYKPDDANHELIEDNLVAGTHVNWRLEYTNGKVRDFEGWCSGFQEDKIVRNGYVSANIEITPTGEVPKAATAA